jgi:hypothetical protein
MPRGGSLRRHVAQEALDPPPVAAAAARILTLRDREVPRTMHPPTDRS